MKKTKKLKQGIVTFAFLLSAHSAHATILWAGGEDIDFPNGSGACAYSGGYRTSYAREAVYSCGNTSSSTPSVAYSNAFPSGGVTSAWFSTRVYYGCNNAEGMSFAGIGNSSGLSAIFVGVSSSTQNKIALWGYNSGTWSQLATEPGTSLVESASNKIDMQVTSGSSGSVNVYINGGQSPIITYSGSLAFGGSNSMDNAFVASSSYCATVSSELIVSTTDTRPLSLATLVPNGAGTTNQWSGTYANIDSTSYNDAVNINSATSGQLFESTVSSLPTGNFSVQAVKIAARAAQGGAPTSLSLGVYSNGSSNSPSAVTQGLSFSTNEILYLTNPNTSSSWVTGDFSGLQLYFTSAP